MHPDVTAPRWRTEEPAVQHRIDLTDQAGATAPTEPYAALLARLAAHLGAAPTHVDYAESQRDRPRHEQWQTLTTTIADHEITVAITADPLDTDIPIYAIVVDGRAVPYVMTGARPLHDVLFEAAAQRLPHAR
ncbi:hypothetical protein [Dactylosporangium sp. CA-139066]|uniref:hypothetical protein n=1 Tax=Dactylosporangium sp. CA-139066 TaxID=3239930 RepID=UPI003D8DAC20